MPAKLGRSARIVVSNNVGTFTAETLEGRGLRIAFDVTKSLTYEANRASVEITNLSKISRDRISGIVVRKGSLTGPERLQLATLANANAAPEALLAALGDPIDTIDSALGIAHVQIFGGYGTTLGLLFEGDTETITHDHQGVDWTSQLESGDAAKRMSQGTIDRSYSPNTPVITTIVDAAHAMGLLVLPNTLAAITAAIGPATHVYGFHMQGSAWGYLQELLGVLVTAEFPFTWSVQDGQLIILASNQTLPLPPLELNPGTGLIGRARRLEAGAVAVDCLLEPGLIPGRQVQLTSRDVVGVFRCDTVRHVGNTYGDGSHSSHAQLTDFLEGIA